MLLFADLTTLFGVLQGVHCLAVQSSFRILDDSDRRKIYSSLRGLSSEKRRFSIIDLNVDILNLFIDIIPCFLGDYAHIGQSTDLPLIIVVISPSSALLIHILFMLNLDAGQSTDIADHCFLLEDELRLFLLFFLVEFLAIVLVHLFHAQANSIL